MWEFKSPKKKLDNQTKFITTAQILPIIMLMRVIPLFGDYSKSNETSYASDSLWGINRGTLMEFGFQPFMTAGFICNMFWKKASTHNQNKIACAYTCFLCMYKYMYNPEIWIQLIHLQLFVMHYQIIFKLMGLILVIILFWFPSYFHQYI